MFISDVEELIKIFDERDRKIIALMEKTIKKAMGKDSKFITTKEVAFELNLTPRTVRDKIKKGLIKALRQKHRSKSLKNLSKQTRINLNYSTLPSRL